MVEVCKQEWVEGGSVGVERKDKWVAHVSRYKRGAVAGALRDVGVQFNSERTYHRSGYEASCWLPTL